MIYGAPEGQDARILADRARSLMPQDKILMHVALDDVRVSALSRSSEVILRNLGAWQGIEQRRAAPYQAMEVWEQDSFARIEFD